MNLLTLIYSIIIIVTASSHDRTKKTDQIVRDQESTSTVYILDDEWPFEDTIRHYDPYVSDLMVKEN